MNDILFVIRMWTQVSLILTQSTRLKDRQTDRQAGRQSDRRRERPWHYHALHYMQSHGKNGSIFYGAPGTCANDQKSSLPTVWVSLCNTAGFIITTFQDRDLLHCNQHVHGGHVITLSQSAGTVRNSRLAAKFLWLPWNIASKSK